MLDREYFYRTWEDLAGHYKDYIENESGRSRNLSTTVPAGTDKKDRLGLTDTLERGRAILQWVNKNISLSNIRFKPTSFNDVFKKGKGNSWEVDIA